MKVVEEQFCLTSGQRWLLHLFEHNRSMARPVQRIYRLNAQFDVNAFQEALEYIMMAHPALRLRLKRTRNGWKQSFPQQEATLSAEEIQGRTPEMRAAYISMLIAAEAKEAMDLRKQSPLRIKIIKSDGEYLLSVCIDHIAADETAFDLFEKKLQHHYQEAVEDRLPPLQLNKEFFNFLDKEQQLIISEEQNLQFWLHQLLDAPVLPDAGDPLRWMPASIFEIKIQSEKLASLQHWCRKNQCSLYNFLIAVQLLILAEAGNKDDLVLNLPISNRARATEKNIIANLSMLLHVRFNGIRQIPPPAIPVWVRNQVLTAMAYRQYDYPSLSEQIALEAEKRGQPINWLLGCNFIAEQEAAVFPNMLYEERIDNQPGRTYDVPATSFTLTAHQSAENLHLLIDWDANCWPIAAGEMDKLFHRTLHSITGNL